jgi:hypothetical protein
VTSRLVRLALAITVAGTPAIVPVSHASAADVPCGQNRPRACLVVRTIPALPSVGLLLDGRRYLTDRDGVARIDAPRSQELELGLVSTRIERDGVRAKFSRWGDDAFTPSRMIQLPSRGNKVLELGFDIEYLVSLHYRDQDGMRVGPSKISLVEVGNSVGARLAIDPPTAPVWVQGGRVIRTAEGLQINAIPYSVRTVVVDGSNVVNEGQQVFEAGPHASWDVELLFYDAAITVKDRFFGFATGSKIDLIYPDGHTVQHTLVDGAVQVRDLPRGNYTIIVHGPGLKLRAPVAVSRDTEAKLVFLSYLDLGVAVAFGLVFAIGLITIGRRRLARERRRLEASSIAPSEPTEVVEVRSEVT